MSLSPRPSWLGRLSARRRGAVAVASVLALSGAAVPALAGCDSASAFACGVRNDSTAALPVSATSISAVLTPRGDNQGLSFSVYDALVPAGFLPAADKQIAVQLTRYDVGRCQTTGKVQGAPVTWVPAPPCRAAAQNGTTSWVEGTIAVAVTRGGDTGWLPLSSPFSSPAELAEATAVGVPGYAAAGDVTVTGTDAQGPTKVSGAVTRAGVQTMKLDFLADRTAVAPASVPGLSLGAPSFYSVTRGTSPVTWRTSRTVRPTAPASDVTIEVEQAKQPGVTHTSDPRKGFVEVRLADVPLSAPGRTLADVVSLEQVAAAFVRAEDGLLITKRDNLTDGKDGTLPVPPAVPGYVGAPPAGATTGFTNPTVAIGPGGTVTLANADTNQEHTFTAQRSGPDGRPLFDGVAKGGEILEIKETSRLAPGSYTFFCSLHSAMRGVLIVG